MPGRAVGREKRGRIVELARTHGVHVAAAEAGVTVATVRRWMSAPAESPQQPNAVVSPPEPDAQQDVEEPLDEPLDELERTRRSAAAAHAVASRAIRKTDDLLAEGKASEARNAAAAGGIWADKARGWDELIAAAEQHNVRITEEQMTMVVAVIELYFDAVGLPFAQGSAARRLLAEMLRQAEAGKPVPASPALAEPAYRAVRDAIGAELREEIERELRDRVEPDWRAEQRGLPAPDAEREAEPVEPMAGPRTVVRTVSEPVEDEVVEAEVVEDEPLPSGWLNMYHDETRARRAWERAKAEDLRREQREREKAAEPTFTEPGVSRSSSFDIDGPNSNMRPPGGKL
jgi:hypothetical protein